jgi:hypothetical protein
MQSLPVVEAEISSQSISNFRHTAIIIQVNIFVLHASPQPLYKDVIQRPHACVLAYLDILLKQPPGKG